MLPGPCVYDATHLTYTVIYVYIYIKSTISEGEKEDGVMLSILLPLE